MSLLSFNFLVICIIDNFLTLLKYHLIYLKDNILEGFFKKYNRLLFLFYFSLQLKTRNLFTQKKGTKELEAE